MAKLKERTKTVSFPALNQYIVRVIVTNDVRGSVDARDIKIENVGYACHIFNNGDSTSYLFLPEGIDAGDIAHECWHVIRRIFDWIGCEGFDNELVAYHLGYLVNKVFNFIYQGGIYANERSGRKRTSTNSRGNRGDRDSSKREVHATPEVRDSETSA